MIIISLGIDCGVASYLKDNNLRTLKDGLILKSQACVFFSKKKAAKLQPFLNSLT